MRIMRQREREAQEEERRREAEANRTDDQRLGDWIAEGFRPGAKEARNAALLRSLGLLEGDER